jgi:hypothetical protein
MMVLYIWMCDKIQPRKENRCIKVIKHRQQKRPPQVTRRGEEYHKASDVSAIKTVQVDWKILWADYDLKNLDDFGVGESNAILQNSTPFPPVISKTKMKHSTVRCMEGFIHRR